MTAASRPSSHTPDPSCIIRAYNTRLIGLPIAWIDGKLLDKNRRTRNPSKRKGEPLQLNVDGCESCKFREVWFPRDFYRSPMCSVSYRAIILRIYTGSSCRFVILLLTAQVQFTGFNSTVARITLLLPLARITTGGNSKLSWYCTVLLSHIIL